MAKTTSDYIYQQNPYSGNSCNIHNKTKYQLSEYFQTWKMATDESSNRVFHIQPNIKNGDIFNTYYFSHNKDVSCVNNSIVPIVPKKKWLLLPL